MNADMERGVIVTVSFASTGNAFDDASCPKCGGSKPTCCSCPPPTLNQQAQELEPKIDFSCRVCGVICPIAPDPPARAVCPEHCEDHDYVTDPIIGRKLCKYCDQEAPFDYYED